jgi:hypothetical protein
VDSDVVVSRQLFPTDITRLAEDTGLTDDVHFLCYLAILLFLNVYFVIVFYVHFCFVCSLCRWILLSRFTIPRLLRIWIWSNARMKRVLMLGRFVILAFLLFLLCFSVISFSLVNYAFFCYFCVQGVGYLDDVLCNEA